MAKIIEKEIKGIKQKWYVKALSCKAENEGTVTATFGFFTDAESAKNRDNAIELQKISFTAIPDVDIFKQTYGSMSELEEFQDAEDC